MTQPNRIRFWRQHKGWTLQQLAEAAGTTRAQIDKLERGSRRLTVDWMVRLAAPLGCDPRSLMETGLAEAKQSLLLGELPLYRLRLSGGKARRSATAERHVAAPFFLPQAAAAYGLLLPKAWQPAPGVQQLALVQPEARCIVGGVCLAKLQDGSVVMGWLQQRDSKQVMLRSLGARPVMLRLTTAAVLELQRVIALIDAV